MKKTHSTILRKRKAEVDTRLSPSWNGQARETVLSSDGISYDGQWGDAPLIVTAAQRGEVLYAVNRSLALQASTAREVSLSNGQCSGGGTDLKLDFGWSWTCARPWCLEIVDVGSVSRSPCSFL